MYQNLALRSQLPWAKAFNQPAIAGGSIKPRVKRSDPWVNAFNNLLAREAGGRRQYANTLSPASRATNLLRVHYPGFRFASPWALCCRLLRRLIEGFYARRLLRSRRDRIEKQWVSSQRLAAILWSKTEENNSSFAQHDFYKRRLASNSSLPQQPT